MIENKEQYFEVVAACQFCHDQLDQRMTHEEMEWAVKDIISNRITEII